MLRSYKRPRIGFRTFPWAHAQDQRAWDAPSVKRRTYAAVTSLGNLVQPGEQLHGFTLKRRKEVPELQLTALQLQHDRTGAEHLHVARDDKNNVFSIGFKTNPPDDTGVPHILEHTTLCGSEKYIRYTLADQVFADIDLGILPAIRSSKCSLVHYRTS